MAKINTCVLFDDLHVLTRDVDTIDKAKPYLPNTLNVG